MMNCLTERMTRKNQVFQHCKRFLAVEICLCSYTELENNYVTFEERYQKISIVADCSSQKPAKVRLKHANFAC